MNPPKCDDLDYQFLVAAQKVFTCTEAARCHPNGEDSPAHDSFTRLLQRQALDTEALWHESKRLVRRDRGVLVLDDTTLHKPYAEKMGPVTHHWSGKHKRVVEGINLLTLCGLMAGRSYHPSDFRLYSAQLDGLTKNDHFRAMPTKAGEGEGIQA